MKLMWFFVFDVYRRTIKTLYNFYLCYREVTAVAQTLGIASDQPILPSVPLFMQSNNLKL